MEASDQNLIKLCRKNKRDGYELLFKKYERYVYKICYYYALSKEDALDLVQEIFLKVFRSLDRFDDEKSILPWIKKISVNTCINFARQNKKGSISLNSAIDDDESTLESILSSDESTENTVVYGDTKRILEESIRKLPEEMRMAIILRHVKGMSYMEIGEAMSCPIGTVKTHIYRGRMLLKGLLKSKGVWEI